MQSDSDPKANRVSQRVGTRPDAAEARERPRTQPLTPRGEVGETQRVTKPPCIQREEPSNLSAEDNKSCQERKYSPARADR